MIKTTHVGSLPRSQKVVDFIFARENQQKYNQQDFDHAMEEGVLEVVAKQKQVGIDIVSDGETSKISYATYVKDRYSGFSGNSPRNAPKDLKLFPSFLKKIASEGGTPTYARPVCSGPVEVLSHNELLKDIARLRNAMKIHNVHHGFMNAASPGVISLFLPNQFYASREVYLEKLANVMKEEYHHIVNAGLTLQIDCPDLALSRHVLFSDLSDNEFVKIAEENVAALNYALADVPTESVRVHICWGNYEGPHVCDISMEKLFSTLMKTKSRYVLFETSNPRHAHEWEVFAERKNDIPDDKILIPGVIDSTTNFVEHPRLVAQRIKQFTDIVGKERVLAGSDCGFGTFAGFGAIDQNIAYEKLAMLRKGADIAANF